MIPRADSPTPASNPDPRLQRKNSSSSLIGALRRLVISTPRDIAICITAQDVLQLTLKGSPRRHVAMLREEMLKHRQEIFDTLPTKCPDISITQGEHRLVYRECNNYLLKPDSGSTEMKDGVVTQFSYKGKSYIPKTPYPIQLLPTGLLCISPLTDLNCDYAACSEHSISFADGCGLGPKAFLAAKLAVEVSQRVMTELMTKRPPSCLKELVSYQLASFEASQAKLKEKENDTGETTLRITSIYGQFAVSTSLGDTMLLLSRREANGTLMCIDPSEQKQTELDSERDSGGCLGANSVIVQEGNKVLSGPDLRSLTVSIVSLKPGDMLHILSDGTYGCFDPFHQGIKPKDIDPSFKEETWNIKSPAHNRKRQSSIRASFLRTIHECQKPEEVAEKLTLYTEAATVAYKLAMIMGQTPLPPGKADHANSVHVQITSC